MAHADPWILGTASSHNGGACLLKGDEIFVAVQEERLVRSKRAEHPGARPSLAIGYCLDYAGISAKDLACVVHTTWHDATSAEEDVTTNPLLRVGSNGVRVLSVTHHLAHAIGAFATSGFQDAAVLVVDGNGSAVADLSAGDRAAIPASQLDRFAAVAAADLMETISLYQASGTAVATLEKHIGALLRRTGPGMSSFWSLGHMYGAVGGQIFGNDLDGAGKVMGLAPYGRPTIPAADFFAIGEDGTLIFRDTVPARFVHRDRWPQHEREYEDLAASVQAALETALLHVVGRLRALSASSRLCYAGGVALNSVANERIIREGGFDQVFIMPAAEDSGTAVGAAYYGLWSLTRQHAGRRLRHDSVGRRYDPARVRDAVAEHPQFSLCDSRDVVGDAAKLLADGMIVGWCHGGSELGPRALGQRSILCDPRRAEMKDVLNARVKFRESFRPFAPAILREHVADWFEGPAGNMDSPYMLRVMRFRDDRRERVPAVVHVDGTGRVQTLTREANPTLYELVRRFYELTGVPLVLNTSFNVAGEPIVETISDVLLCFEFSGVDACVVEHQLIQKNPGMRPLLDRYVSLIAASVGLERPVLSGSLSRAADLPASDTFTGFQSSHSSRIVDVQALAARYPVAHARIISDKTWGRILTIASPDVVRVLRHIDGTRTGQEVLSLLQCSSGGPAHTADSLHRLLLRLAQASIVAFHDAPRPRRALAVESQRSR